MKERIIEWSAGNWMGERESTRASCLVMNVKNIPDLARSSEPFTPLYTLCEVKNESVSEPVTSKRGSAWVRDWTMSAIARECVN